MHTTIIFHTTEFRPGWINPRHVITAWPDETAFASGENDLIHLLTTTGPVDILDTWSDVSSILSSQQADLSGAKKVDR